VVIVVVVIGVPISMVGMIPVVLIATVGVTVVPIPILVFATVVPLAKEAAGCERERNSGEQAGDPDHAASQPRRSCAPHDDTHYVTSNDDVAPPEQRTVRSGALLALAAAHRLAARDLATPLLATGSRRHAVLAKTERTIDAQAVAHRRQVLGDSLAIVETLRLGSLAASEQLVRARREAEEPGVRVRRERDDRGAAARPLAHARQRAVPGARRALRQSSGDMERLETALHVANHDGWRTLLMVAEYPD
jgi:hypothetical protein